MKRGAIEHPKVRALAEALGCGRAQAVGHLESLWHFTSRYAPAGDIGRWSDADIASGCYWDGPPDKFIAALVACRWVDVHEGSRLVVHDWYEHADDSVHMALARSVKWFASGQIPKMSRLTKEERESAHRAFDAAKINAQKTHDVRTENALPCLSLPSPALPKPEPLAEADSFSNTIEPDPDATWMIREVAKAIGHQPSSSQQYQIIEEQTKLDALPLPIIGGKPKAWRDVFAAACTKALQEAKNKSAVPFTRYAVEIAKGAISEGVMPGTIKPSNNGKVQPGPVLTGKPYRPFVRGGPG